MKRGELLCLGTLFYCLLILAFPSRGWSQNEATPGEPAQGELADATPAEEPGNVTMDFKDADINTVLRLLSLKSGVNIVAGPEVKGTVTVRLENVPWEEALKVVLRTYGYVYEKVGNIIRVTTKENLAQEDIITDTFILDYTTAAEVESAVKDMLTERGRIKTATRTNMVVISDVPTNVYKIGEVVQKLDKPTPQAYIDSKIVKTQLDKGENLGIRWNAASMGISAGASRPTTFPFASQKDTNKEYIPGFSESFFPQIGGATTTSGTSVTNTATANTGDVRFFPFPNAVITNQGFQFGTLDFTQFSALLSMLESRSNTKVVSNPRIVVLNNQQAEVKVGSEIPIPTFERNETTGSFEVTGFTYRDVGVVLKVTPHINSADEILVDLKPEVSSLGATITYTATLAAPSFDVTNAVTQVLIRSGETIAIGGLMQDSVATSEQRFPYIASIPGVGKLFRSKRQTEGSSNRKSETIFFVTVTMIDMEGQPTVGKKDKKKTPLPSQETVGSQSVVNTPQAPPLTPTAAGTG
ncbi:MAG: secretin and TonB N-terminal domain-containing protein [Candidatus Omnitrophica bacterium]|nr:secretin and TonB N-terminal domain-containing protein [Candidatus Omnitrophota bacterium]